MIQLKSSEFFCLTGQNWEKNRIYLTPKPGFLECITPGTLIHVPDLLADGAVYVAVAVRLGEVVWPVERGVSGAPVHLEPPDEVGMGQVEGRPSRVPKVLDLVWRPKRRSSVWNSVIPVEEVGTRLFLTPPCRLQMRAFQPGRWRRVRGRCRSRLRGS